ncbi:MAG: hypothetical protein KGJ90_06785 [Patescibacteria group bacterium]|nr:hypothetical protein [Patescibacteria group bacterium]
MADQISYKQIQANAEANNKAIREAINCVPMSDRDLFRARILGSALCYMPPDAMMKALAETLEWFSIDRMNAETLRRCNGNPATTDPRTGVDSRED